MAGAAKVTTTVYDLTNRVQPSGSYASAIVIASKIGKVNVPMLVTGQTDFLRKYTVDEKLEVGWDNAFYEAWQYLKTQPNLYVVRAAHTDGPLKCLYGGCKIRTMKSSFKSVPFEKGFSIVQSAADEVPFIEQDLDYRPYKELDPSIEILEDPDTHQKYILDNGVARIVTKLNNNYVMYEIEDDTAAVIYSSSEGDFANRIAISIITDPEEVKLAGCFIIKVYKQNEEKQYIKVEEHVCSLNPTLKDGYGVSTYIESVLGASKYIRGLANPLDYVVKDTSYILDVVGKVTLKNPYIYVTQRFSENAFHEVGDIIMVPQITGRPGYYECTQAGQSASSTTKSVWVSENEYKEKVEEGTVVWRLRDQVRPYVLDTIYTMGDVVKVQEGLYYKAMNSGRTGTRQPQVRDDNNQLVSAWGNDFVDDGDIKWTKQTQEVEVTRKVAYTNYSGTTGTLPNNYTAYADEFLAGKLVLPETIAVTDTTTVDPVYGTHLRKTYNVEYTINVTGEETDDHYVLPKSTQQIDGTYALIKLGGGFDGAVVETGDRIRALNSLKSTKEYQFQLIQDGGETTPTYASQILELCSARKEETHGIISTPINNELGRLSGDSVTDILTYKRETLNTNSKLMELYTTHQLIYDEFNDRNIYVSPSCFMTANILRYARELGWHWAVAGYTRGKINSLDVAYVFDEDQLDKLADNQINAIIKEPGEGIVCWDEQTMIARACDLQDAHIARYIDLYLRPTLKAFLKGYLFEFNDEETRRLISQRMDVFMKSEQAARAVYDYRIICDETNNLPADIEANILNCWLLIKPTKIAKFINQSIIITPYSMDFGDAVEMM